MSDHSPTHYVESAYNGLDSVHANLSEAKKAYGGPCPCGPPALSEALESVQAAELKLEKVLYGISTEEGVDRE